MVKRSNKESKEMNLSDAFRRAFHPTPEEELEDLKRFVDIHNLAKSKKRCSTCTKWTPPPSDLPGFVEDHGDCGNGHTVDTIKNCPDYVCSGDQCMNDIFSRIKELEKMQTCQDNTPLDA